MDIKVDRAKSPIAHYIFAHGAGAPMDSDWMNQMTTLLTGQGISVYRFEFPYMVERRENGKKRPPNTQKVLLSSWREAIEQVSKITKLPATELFIGGKSMGGRMATILMAEQEIKVKGIVALGFPFHAPGKEPGKRLDHFENLKTKTLVIQGSRDSMGTREEIETYPLPTKMKVLFLEDGDHSLKPRVKSGFTLEGHLEDASKMVAKFVK